MAFRAASIIIKEVLTDQSNPSIAFLDSFMAANKSGSNKGKLSTDIKLKFEFEREAMAETKLRIPANPMLPSKTAIQ